MVFTGWSWDKLKWESNSIFGFKPENILLWNHLLLRFKNFDGIKEISVGDNQLKQIS